MRISICGFYGQGNFGDELMLYGMAGWLKARGHEVYCQSAWTLEHRERMLLEYDGWPLDDVRTFDDRALAGAVDLLIIGGGDLEPGFAWNLIPMAMRSGTRIAMLGQTFTSDWVDNDRVLSATAPLLNQLEIWSRDLASTALLRANGIGCSQGADPAFLIKPPKETVGNGAVIFVGECQEEEGSKIRLSMYETAVSRLKQEGTEYRVLCCNFADEQWGHRHGIPVLAYEPPLRLLEMIASSDLVVSIDRLHPCVAAKLCGVRHWALSPRMGKWDWQDEMSQRYTSGELRSMAERMMESVA